MILVADADSPITTRLLLEWIALAALTALGLALLPNEFARGAVSNLLSLIAAVYVGFALASKDRASIPVQALACAGFVALALLGLWFSWWFLVLGLALHGVWDFFHHGERGRNIVPSWYPPACAVYDWLVAIFVAIRYAI